MEHLSKKQENFCDNTGLMGVLLSITSLLQHLYFMIASWITISIIGVYILTLVAFILLMKRSPWALLLLFISSLLLFVVESLLILSLTYSLILLILLLYSVVIVALIFVPGILQKDLWLNHAAKKAEAMEWQGKV